MKKIMFLMSVIWMMATFVSCSSADEIYSIADESDDCALFLHAPSCVESQEAKEYVQATYPSAAIRFVDVENPSNVGYLNAARRDYRLSDTHQKPVICFGKQHVEGWSAEKKQILDFYIQRYLGESTVTISVDTFVQRWNYTVVISY